MQKLSGLFLILMICSPKPSNYRKVWRQVSNWSNFELLSSKTPRSSPEVERAETMEAEDIRTPQGNLYVLNPGPHFDFKSFLDFTYARTIPIIYIYPRDIVFQLGSK